MIESRVRRGRARRIRRWAWRMGTVFLAASLVAAVAALSLGRHITPRPAAADTSPTDVIEIHSAHGASFLPALEGRRPIFILALGSDARPGESIERQRSDSIHVIGINPALHRATILGFPRDSWVPIPGFGTSKINTAMADGGPSLTVRTIENLTGIRIDFWMLTSFQGLANLVNGIGGLTVRVLQPMHDGFSGSNFKPGVRHFSGSQALAFARDRHSFTQGDLARSANQGRLFLAALSSLHSVFARDPAQILRWLMVGWRNIHTDLSVRTLLDLALTATKIPLNHVNNLVVPATTGTVGSASVVFIRPSASGIYADMRADGVVR
jgi:polyisoprenyl-teichoic acid--peptidoglycan teichoic acid transferase